MKQDPFLIPVLLAIIFVSILGNIYLYFHKNINFSPTPFDTSILITPTLYPSLVPTIPATTSTSVNGLVTYTNREDGLSFQYPEDWYFDGGVLSNYDPSNRGPVESHQGDIKCDLFAAKFVDESTLVGTKQLKINSKSTIYQSKLQSELYEDIFYTVFSIYSPNKSKLNHFICYSLAQNQIQAFYKVLSSFEFIN